MVITRIYNMSSIAFQAKYYIYFSDSLEELRATIMKHQGKQNWLLCVRIETTPTKHAIYSFYAYLILNSMITCLVICRPTPILPGQLIHILMKYKVTRNKTLHGKNNNKIISVWKIQMKHFSSGQNSKKQSHR